MHKPLEAGNKTSGKLGNWRHEFLITQEIGMLYNRHSDTELERAVYIDPTNTAARDELIARVPSLLDNRSDQLQEAEMMLEVSERERKSEIAAYEDSLDSAQAHARDLQRDLDGAHDRIAQLTRDLDSTRQRVAKLTRAEDLV